MTGAPSWPPYYFDLADPDGPGDAPKVIVPILIDWLAHETTHTPDWRIDQPDGALVRLSLIEKSDDEARIGFAAGEAEGVIRLVHEASGWLGVEVTMDGAEVFRAWADRPYEEYELWPGGAAKAPDSPGSMGKKRNWLSLNTNAWPQLRELADGGNWLNLHAMDYITLHVRLTGEGADVWRPVRAVPSDFGFELLAPKGEDTARWEFPPGSIVRCEMMKLAGEDVVAVVGLVSR